MVVHINIRAVMGMATPVNPGPSGEIPAGRIPLIIQGENATSEANMRDFFHLRDTGVVQNCETMYGTTNINNGPQMMRK